MNTYTLYYMSQDQSSTSSFSFYELLKTDLTSKFGSKN